MHFFNGGDDDDDDDDNDDKDDENSCVLSYCISKTILFLHSNTLTLGRKNLIEIKFFRQKW